MLAGSSRNFDTEKADKDKLSWVEKKTNLEVLDEVKKGLKLNKK